MGRDSFTREIKSLHKTLGKTNYEETRQLFLNNVLTEALDDGSPMYYNSNILGSCLLYTSPSPRDATLSRMPSSA